MAGGSVDAIYPPIFTPVFVYPDKSLRLLFQRLKSALWYHIGKTVDAEGLNLGVNASPQFIGSLTELVWTQIGEPSYPFINLSASASFLAPTVSSLTGFL